MRDPLGKFLLGAVSGYLFRKDRGAEKRADQVEREERKAIERDIKRLRAEKRYLVMQRVYNTLVSSLSQLPCGQFNLPSLAGPAAITRIAAEVTKLVARELGRED